MRENDQKFMKIALAQAQKSLDEGGIPIGACLVIDGQVVAKGHNQRVQQNNPILHGEMDCLAKAGRLKPKDYLRSALYTTLSPCHMCSGAVLLYKIPRVVMAENKTFVGAEDWLRANGVELVNLNLPEAVKMMAAFIKKHPDVWNEDISI
ncbi:MAG: tRNA-specific adenosine deaminase [Gammaproteobacteria bacterium RIFCSPHIGHO2_02_FULL_42_13]|nr:MAG: tRNA-specific adenosine deaminase [Gammaproteobacteria bacterium RIFCSPHIGHO2_02_FULL_42_13]OGT70762.1 MAG: tRNA-specific adenosine deaminase [Gammaproteobacteria bacterium RIFCSPLOWO2_02_FULL_42_9]